MPYGQRARTAAYVLIAQTVDLVDLLDLRDDITAEWSNELTSTGGNTLGRLGLDVSDDSHGLEEVTDGVEALAGATTLLDVLEDGVLTGTSVTLQGKVVVGHGLTVLGHSLQPGVSHT